jgi:hypothetical protein
MILQLDIADTLWIVCSEIAGASFKHFQAIHSN